MNPLAIAALTLLNCQGLSKKYQFAPANLLLAPNMSGKTAIMDAIRLIHLGDCVSVVDGSILKGTAAAQAMASDFPLGITLEYNNGASLELSLTKKGKTATFTHEPPEWMDERTRLILNPDLFFGASGPERIKMLARCLSSAQMTDDEVLAKFAETELPKISVAKSILDKKLAALKPVISAHTILSAKIEAACKNISTSKNESAAASKRLLQTAEGMTELAAIETDIADLPSLDSINTELTDLRAKKQAAESEKSSVLPHPVVSR